ncbi:MAG: DUF3794 domain-containing protein [Ruminococcaceae bacterium]|nr:DUF3794 domain-containing protein [Oscillospiraceae bacterium]
MENFVPSAKGNSEIYSRVFQKSREIIECSRDFILPDFYADIKRIIGSSGSISPESCFVEGGKASMSGTLTTKVLFLDDENKLRAVTFTQDYSASIPVGDNGAYGDISMFCCPVLENVSVKTVNPRKVSVRGRIDANLKIWKNISVSPEMSNISANGDITPEMKREDIRCIRPFSVWERDLEMSEDIILENEAEEIIYCDAKSEVNECIPENNAIMVKGNTELDVIYMPSNATEPIHIHRRVPFTRIVETEFASLDNLVCCACSYVRSTDCNIAAANGGENNKIEIDVAYSLAVNGAGIVSCQYVSDMYVPAFAVKNESEKINFSSDPIKTVKSVRVESCTDSMIPAGSTVELSIVSPTVDSISSEDGVRSAFGNSLITVVYKDNEGLYGSQSFSGDFALELKDLSDFDEYIFLIRVSSVNARVEEERLCVGYDLEINILSWKSEVGEIIKNSQILSGENFEDRKPFTVYYPAKNETLWDVGKKYNVTVSSLVSANPSYTENAEKMPSVLLIPRHKQIKKANNI